MPGSRSSSSPVLLLLIILAGVVLGYVYESQMDRALIVPTIDPHFQATSTRGLNNLLVDYSFLRSGTFGSLQIFGDLPVLPGSGGKTNPFQ